MAYGRHVENRYDVMTLTRTTWFQWNLTCWRRSTCRWQ